MTTDHGIPKAAIERERPVSIPADGRSALEVSMQFQMRAVGVDEPVIEFLFHPRRKWRFDFAWPARMVALEVEGGTWSGGRHTTGTGYEEDAEKYRTAFDLGWRVLRVTGAMVDDGRALESIERALRRVEGEVPR